MPAPTMATEIQILTSVVNSLGVVGLLIFFVIAFYRGDIVSKPVLEKIISSFLTEINSRMNSMEDKIEKAIQQDKGKGW